MDGVDDLACGEASVAEEGAGGWAKLGEAVQGEQNGQEGAREHNLLLLSACVPSTVTQTQSFQHRKL